jgi:PPOX class probable F420-dependent enzyme
MATANVTPDAPAERRLDREPIIWLTTVGADGHPHAVPVWFWWDGKSFLIYSVPGRKVRDIRGNPNVELHLNTDRTGDKLVMVDGKAKVVRNQPPANRVSKYITKYRERIRGYGWTPKSFAEQYRVAIRVTPTRISS